MENLEMTEQKIQRLMALKKDLEGPYKEAFIRVWGKDVIDFYREKIKKIIELDNIEHRHSKSVPEMLDIAEINVEDWYD